MKREAGWIHLAVMIPFLAFAGGTHAEVKEGSTRDDVLREWGKPKSRMAIGREETFIYEGNVRVFMDNGKVIGFKNKQKIQPNPMPAASVPPKKPDPAPGLKGIAGDKKAREKLATAPPDLTEFLVPDRTIIVEPDFRARGTAGGESDGKTMGVDGKPLADHSQYANDIAAFSDRLNIGLKALAPELNSEELYAIKKIFREKREETAKALAMAYEARYKHRAEDHPLYDYSALLVALEEAYNAYQTGVAQLNYSERLKVRDRVDLNDEPSARGAEIRGGMKAAIWKMAQVRSLIMNHYGAIYEKGRELQQAQHSAMVAKEVRSVVARDDAQFFIYQKFERTPMLSGLQHAAAGKRLDRAKPLLLPKGAKVQVLERTTKPVEAADGLPGGVLQIVKIKIKDPGVRQLDGARLDMTFEGRTLARNIQ